ncbi:MAG TPA: SatD family protein [Cyclobacteriaceae bacterium]|nr:SatD family protein [Cyclobacteriaceae bacterium]
MADIIDSSGKESRKLMNSLRHIVEDVNSNFSKREILSPLTITLGDEFQSVLNSVEVACKVILFIEEKLLARKADFSLRYVIHEGKIDTPINKVRAHEMLGPGLTQSRKLLSSLKSSKERFLIDIDDKEKSEKLSLSFKVYEGLVNQWTTSSRDVVYSFLQEDDYKILSKKLKKDPSTVWRRKHSLMIDEYKSMRELIMKLAA